PAAPDPRRGRQPRPVPPQRPVNGQQAGTLQRPGGGARTDGRRGRGVPPQAGPAKGRGAQQTAVPQAQPVQKTQPARPGQQALRARAARAGITGSHRMPFVLLLCGLLGGALVSALVISTTLAEGSFQINKLQDSTSSLARQRQTLEDQVAQAQSAQVIAQRASQLGMRRPGELQFVNLKTGKVTSTGPTWSGAAHAPGYAP
ncbi:MAG TPA: hypothetical protein VF223_07995, partial [Trebonia sp.]